MNIVVPKDIYRHHDFKLSLQHLELVDPAQVEDGDDLHDVGGVDRSNSHVEPFFATMLRWSGIKIFKQR